jgi:ABC-type transporter Mla maintaining outer membrane lipid asymmetry permease subunit MlaE
MVINVIGIIIGILILFAGIFYGIKEKGDKESLKIYAITAVIGAIVVVAFVVKMLLSVA